MEEILLTRKVKNILYRSKPIRSSRVDKDLEAEEEKKYLLKYSPKYYKTLSLNSIRAPLISKLKRVKRLHHFQFSTLNNNPLEVLPLIFANKRKDVQVLPKLIFARELSKKKKYLVALRELRLFSRLRQLSYNTDNTDNTNDTVVSFESDESDGDDEICTDHSEIPIHLTRVQYYIASLRALNHLKISFKQGPNNIDTNNFLIKKLNSQRRLLSSLKSFKVGFGDNLFEEPSSLYALEPQNLFLRYLTHLTIGIQIDSDERWFALFILALSNCENISMLSIRLNLFKSALYKQAMDKVYSSFFNSLLQRKRLKSIDLNIQSIDASDLSKFLQYFSLPPTVKNIKLALCFEDIAPLIERDVSLINSQNDLMQWINSVINISQKNEACKKFYELWKRQLFDLDSLQLNFAHSIQDIYYILAGVFFMIPLMRNIKRLNSLKWFPGSLPNDANLDVNFILNEINHLKPSLWTLKFSLGKKLFSSLSTFNPRVFQSFPNLSDLFLGFIKIDEDVENIKNVLRIIPEFANTNQFSLSTLKPSSIKSFQLLLNCLKGIKKAETLKVSIKICLSYSELTQGLKALLNFVVKSSNLKNISLYIFTEFKNEEADDIGNYLIDRLSTQLVFEEIHFDLYFLCEQGAKERIITIKNGKRIIDVLGDFESNDEIF